jgi:ketosteroid isomerase-like protein
MKPLPVSAIGASLVFAIAFAQPARAANDEVPCAPSAAAEPAVVRAIEQMYAAFRADDAIGLQRIATTDFYAYDNGAQFTAASLLDLLKKAHASGTRFEWSVVEPQVHVACNLAWVTYVNEGSIDNAAGHRKMQWLESAVLEYREQQWRIRFFHSTRATVTP